MRIWIVLISVVVALNGCAMKTHKDQQKLTVEADISSKEEMLVSTENNEKLVEFYKEILKKNDSAEVRVKLVKVYLDMKDYESADFHVNQITLAPENQAEVLYLKAKIANSQGHIDKAFEDASHALEISPGMPEVENLLGMLWANKGDYQKSRNYFTLARLHFFDDVIIKNNLAVLDLIQGKYQAAVDRLLPLYQKGKKDAQINANLALAYAKLGQYKLLELILKEQKYTTSQTRKIFTSLNQATPASEDKKQTQTHQKRLDTVLVGTMERVNTLKVEKNASENPQHYAGIHDPASNTDDTQGLSDEE